MKPILIVALVAAALLLVGCGSLGNTGLNLGGNPSRTYTYNSLPKTIDDLLELPGAAEMTDPYAVGALTVAALTRYGDSPRDCIAMLNYLKGPESVPISTAPRPRTTTPPASRTRLRSAPTSIPSKPTALVTNGARSGLPPAAPTIPVRSNCARKAAPGNGSSMRSFA